MTSDAEYVVEIFKENEELKMVNGYLQSYLNVYNNWFSKLNIKEDLHTISRLDIDCQRGISKTYKTMHFPDIQLIEYYDDDTLKVLDRIANKSQKCNVCGSGTKPLEFRGDRLKFCFECGRALL